MTKTKLIRILIALVIVGLVGFAVFLMTWDIPRPVESVEKPVSNENFAE